eukprot:jgi/Astpho2/3620/Aster-06912
MVAEQAAEQLRLDLKQRKLQGSLACAKRTASVLHSFIAEQQPSSAIELVDAVRQLGRQLQAAKPQELAVGNMVRRILHMIRSESDQEVEEELEAVSPDSSAHSGGSPALWRRKRAILQQITALEVELDDIADNIAAQADDYIHANEVILTFGMSETTSLFLQEAARKRDFQVVVAEGAPRYGGHEHARQLAAAGIPTTAITDSAIFAMMARVNKVLIGAHIMLANGGVMAAVGTHMVAQAARHHRIPIVVVAGLHKLSPLFPHDPSITFNDFGDASDIIDVAAFTDSQPCRAAQRPGLEPNFQVPNPIWDYIPPELISLFVTDTGGHTPSYVYRLLAEFYSREDYTLVNHVSGAHQQTTAQAIS